ncbi:putative Hsp70 nucleotide exchange factor [Teratosphaeria nubilosa]|uniref:Putative Hsp70 nucleotide exchange factor n=1 Tax=Teratosphaeria nubilosa TaxID=161662 RepID=A0A6G1LHF1_9PEZI|nr:putative Hsp70 nucleotide exchange factor [Teratosphaeria nubilosa]
MARDQQQSLNELLKWSVENSDASHNDPTAPTQPTRNLNPEILQQILGGPSDADRMREAMTAIIAPPDQVDPANKLIAWDNLERLIEPIDNANNLESLGMWKPLIEQLDHAEPGMRRSAAACCSTAVQNNIKSQEKLLQHGGMPTLARLATEDPDRGVRKKAVSALSSQVRNFQPGLDELERCLPEGVWRRRGVEAGDMEAVDELIRRLREHAAR